VIIVDVQVLDRGSVDKNLSLGRLVEAKEQFDESRLSGPVLPDNGDFLIRLDGNVDVLQCVIV